MQHPATQLGITDGAVLVPLNGEEKGGFFAETGDFIAQSGYFGLEIGKDCHAGG